MKNLEISNLLDFYECLLTEKQRDMTRLYYCEDFSLSEIAEEMGVSRQAAQEGIARSIKKLEEYENGLRMRERFLETQKIIAQIKDEMEILPDVLQKILLLEQIWEDK